MVRIHNNGSNLYFIYSSLAKKPKFHMFFMQIAANSNILQNLRHMAQYKHSYSRHYFGIKVLK